MCVWVQLLATSRHFSPGFVVCVFGVGFRGNPPISGSGLGCTCFGMDVGCAPPILAGVCCLCVLVWVFPAARNIPGWGVGACAVLRAHRPYPATPGSGCLWRRFVWGSPWAGLLPPPVFFWLSFWLRGGVCGCVLGPVVLWLCGGWRSLSRSGPPLSPPPLLPSFGFLFVLLCPCPCGQWPATSLVGVCAGVYGVLFPPALRQLCGRGGPLSLAGSLQVP